MITGGKVAASVRGHLTNPSHLKVYNLNDGPLIWSLTGQKGFIGMTEVSLGGKQCLAISFT